MDKRALVFDQINEKMNSISLLRRVVSPPSGWIKAIRMALGMSMKQLGKRLSITPQAVRDIERREKEGSITIKSMQEVGRVLDLKFVYGFVPNEGTLEDIIQNRAMEIALSIVSRTSNTMKLEDQENSQKRLKKATKERAAKIIEETPKILWD